jgi:hypothetical protein
MEDFEDLPPAPEVRARMLLTDYQLRDVGTTVFPQWQGETQLTYIARVDSFVMTFARDQPSALQQIESNRSTNAILKFIAAATKLLVEDAAEVTVYEIIQRVGHHLDMSAKSYT